MIYNCHRQWIGAPERVILFSLVFLRTPETNLPGTMKTAPAASLSNTHGIDKQPQHSLRNFSTKSAVHRSFSLG